jgi:hypothetical protein
MQRIVCERRDPKPIKTSGGLLLQATQKPESLGSVVVYPTLKKGALEAALDAVNGHEGSRLLTSNTLVGLALQWLATALLGSADGTTRAMSRLDTRP